MEHRNTNEARSNGRSAWTLRVSRPNRIAQAEQASAPSGGRTLGVALAAVALAIGLAIPPRANAQNIRLYRPPIGQGGYGAFRPAYPRGPYAGAGMNPYYPRNNNQNGYNRNNINRNNTNGYNRNNTRPGAPTANGTNQTTGLQQSGKTPAPAARPAPVAPPLPPPAAAIAPGGTRRQTSGPEPVYPPPAVPMNLAVRLISGTTAHLTWQDLPADATAFFIERSTAGGPFQTIGATGRGVLRFTDTSLEAGQAYRYRVQAANHGTPSPYSLDVGVKGQ
jgi:hypothetical protein